MMHFFNQSKLYLRLGDFQNLRAEHWSQFLLIHHVCISADPDTAASGLGVADGDTHWTEVSNVFFGVELAHC
jgi:hypothetical protein